eukprot:CAMPEP_0197705696 /NCGR_PEP_ID=MMETSP1338-20131121/126572_1 /TAXON_ID=43686 ORGANISM="Pelagodinium beii, Strain RCC1491" /NCGR_SAMPLE_ID=MMETSP1338 /ASSEMBLY_ACC=CAM_ASM_000754 /LENGTH=181 /DNA_ID=CAMNT_0043289605 /DNA_START=499 /DNA_END=1041 /DNA_ORIENTATION=+
MGHAVVLECGQPEFLAREEPAEVSVPKTVFSVVRVPLRISGAVVHCMCQRPALNRPLIGDGEHDHQQGLHEGRRLVGLVSPEPMSPSSDSKPADGPQSEGEETCAPSDFAHKAEPKAIQRKHMAKRNSHGLNEDTVGPQFRGMLEEHQRSSEDPGDRTWSSRPFPQLQFGGFCPQPFLNYI